MRPFRFAVAILLAVVLLAGVGCRNDRKVIDQHQRVVDEEDE